MTLEFADEVVTRSLLREVRVPGLDKPAALITLDNGHDHTRPHTFGPAGLAALEAAVREALAGDPAFVAVTGKPYVFCAGADLSGMALIRGREDARAIAALGHRAFGALREAPVPTFAFVNGAALGGGLELALHCRYRTVAGGVRALALPEVQLGLIPGWGGTQLLPNLIGVAGAAQVIVQNPLRQNRMLTAEQAHELGIADALFAPADFLERSLAWAAQVVAGEVTVSRPEVDRDLWEQVLFFARSQLAERLHGAVPAADRALDLLELARDTPYPEGAVAEEEALADLLLSDELKAGVYAFDLVQRRAKRPAGAPDPALAREPTLVGVVGAGLMASQLALLFARRLEVPVVMSDLDQQRVDKGVAYVHQEIGKLVDRGRLTEGKAAKLRGLVTGTTDKAAGYAGADLVIEAVFEELAVKKRVFAELEAIVGPECVLATNTSSLSVTAIGEDLKHPERVVGLHFFNPVAVMPLVEVVRGAATDDATLATAFATGKALRKSCVLVGDAPAFVVNRLLFRFLGEVFAAIDAGTPVDVADTALDPLGLPMRPLSLLDLVGAPVAHHIGQIMHQAFPDRFPVSDNLRRIADSGRSRLLTEDGTLDPSLAELLETGDSPLTTEQVRDRALAALGEEIRLMLDERVVADAKDIDLCLILGAGWPFHLGGITPYLRRTGYL